MRPDHEVIIELLQDECERQRLDGGAGPSIKIAENSKKKAKTSWRLADLHHNDLKNLKKKVSTNF